MHELSLARGIVETVLKAQKEQKAKEITEVKVVLGELQQIEPKYFKKLLQEISKESLTATNFIVELKKGTEVYVEYIKGKK